MRTDRSAEEKAMMQDFGSRLRMVMSEKRITGKKLSEKSGITRESISAYCRGKRGPGFRELMRISIALGISPALLFCSRLAALDRSVSCWNHSTGEKGSEAIVD